MNHLDTLITDHLDLWSAAVRPKSSAGRGNNSKLELTGIKKLRELILELAEEELGQDYWEALQGRDTPPMHLNQVRDGTPERYRAWCVHLLCSHNR